MRHPTAPRGNARHHHPLTCSGAERFFCDAAMRRLILGLSLFQSERVIRPAYGKPAAFFSPRPKHNRPAHSTLSAPDGEVGHKPVERRAIGMDTRHHTPTSAFGSTHTVFHQGRNGQRKMPFAAAPTPSPHPDPDPLIPQPVVLRNLSLAIWAAIPCMEALTATPPRHLHRE